MRPDYKRLRMLAAQVPEGAADDDPRLLALLNAWHRLGLDAELFGVRAMRVRGHWFVHSPSGVLADIGRHINVKVR